MSASTNENASVQPSFCKLFFAALWGGGFGLCCGAFILACKSSNPDSYVPFDFVDNTLIASPSAGCVFGMSVYAVSCCYKKWRNSTNNSGAAEPLV